MFATLFKRLRYSNHFFWLRFYLLILIVGIIAGLGAIFFNSLIGFFHNIFFYGRFSLSFNVLEHAAPSIWGVGIILVPVVGAVCVAFLITTFALKAKGHVGPETLDAIYNRNGIIRPVATIAKILASAISIGSGASVGRIGPVIQIGSAFGSVMSQWMQISKWERITLIACGAGGGIAAILNTPFGGLLFALELMVTEMSVRTVIPVIVATAIATYVSQLYFGNQAFIPLSIAIPDITVLAFFSYIFLGVIIGLTSVIFIKAIYGFEDLFDRLPGNYYLRHMFGMFLVGLLTYGMMQYFGHYYIQGVGAATVRDVLTATLTHPEFLFFIAGLKILDTGISFGSGASGGILSPSMFIGAALGASFVGFFARLFSFHFPMSLELGALAGIAGMIGASVGTPLAAIILAAELTNSYTAILPLMVIVAVAYGVRRSLLKESIYTLRLSRRGQVVPDAFQKHL